MLAMLSKKMCNQFTVLTNQPLFRSTIIDMNSIVIRLSSLGDVVLAGAITASMAPVTFITKKQYQPIAARLSGVSKVLSPTDPLPVKAPCVIDLQGNFKSRKIAKSIDAPIHSITKPRWSQWQRIIWKSNRILPTIPERYAAAAKCNISNKPWINLPRNGKKLCICPCSHHKTKRWPLRYYVSIIQHWPHDVVLLGSANERSILEEIRDKSAKPVSIVAENGFDKTFEALQASCLVIGNDTGIVHIAAAMDIPVIMLFGPTTSTDGFWCHDGIALELPMYCRPCSRFGGSICPFDDHACLENITPKMVWQAAQRYLE
jgi:ADP-heptose:LPS heptosyltransferase